MRPAELIRKLTTDGWFEVKQTGSHIHFHHPVKTSVLIVPYHASRDIPTGARQLYLEESRTSMTRTYLVVFEKGTDGGWGAFAPDVLGTGGLGDTPKQARESLREGIGSMLEDCVERGVPIPEAKSMSVDFSEFDPNPSHSHYEVEWLTVEVPEPARIAHEDAQQAA